MSAPPRAAPISAGPCDSSGQPVDLFAGIHRAADGLLSASICLCAALRDEMADESDVEALLHAIHASLRGSIEQARADLAQQDAQRSPGESTVKRRIRVHRRRLRK